MGGSWETFATVGNMVLGEEKKSEERGGEGGESAWKSEK